MRFRQLRLNRADVLGLQQLGLEQFADAGQLMPGHGCIGIGQQTV